MRTKRPIGLGELLKKAMQALATVAIRKCMAPAAAQTRAQPGDTIPARILG